jgi:hypothetical protein
MDIYVKINLRKFSYFSKLYIRIWIGYNRKERGTMFWLVVLSPLIVLVPIVIYLDRKKGAGDPKLDSDNYRIERDQALHDKSSIFPGGNGPAGG